MGILREPAAFIRSLALPPGFSVCELGDQHMAGVDEPKLARTFYESLGCGRYEAIDGNGMGTVTADLNQPLPRSIGTFDLVTDFGTGEHIFDQAQVWRTMHDLTKVGGYLAFDRPHQGYTKHCFYLVNPTLLRDLAAANVYTVVQLTTKETPRGWLCRGVFRRVTAHPFRIPQQGRYQAGLRLPQAVA